MRLLIKSIVAIAAFGGAVTGVQALGPAPSWQLTQGAAGTCTDDDVVLPGVEINAPSAASERGVLSAPGFPNLGFSQDSSFTGVGTYGFTVFTGPYSLPSNTPLTMQVRTYRGPNYSGGVAYVSTLTWDCTTGAVLALINEVAAPPAPVPTMSDAALAAMAVLLAALGLAHTRRRRAF